MFYIRLENQFHLLLVLIFSSYIYFSSLTVKLDSFLKNYGAAFFSPLVLCMMSFLTLNTALAESYLFFSEFVLITAMFIILAFKNSKSLHSVIFILLYAFPVAVVLLNVNFDSLHKHTILNVCLYACTGMIFLIILSCLVRKRYSLLAVHSGICLLCLSLLMPKVYSSDTVTALSLIFKTVSYILFAFFFCNSTVRKLEKEYITASDQLARINENIQREVNLRLARLEGSGIPPAELAKTDSLTETYTEKAVCDFIEYLIERDPNSEFSVLVINIVNYRKISSKLGHLAGEKCIRALASVLKKSAENGSKTGRYGESGFLVVMPGVNIAKAWYVAEQIENTISAMNEPHFEISAGVVSYPLDGGNIKDLTKAIKKAFRSSKKQ